MPPLPSAAEAAAAVAGWAAAAASPRCTRAPPPPTAVAYFAVWGVSVERAGRHPRPTGRPSGRVACQSRPREIRGTESLERLRGRSGRAGPDLAVPDGPSIGAVASYTQGRARDERLHVRVCPLLVWESWAICRDYISGARHNGELSRFLCVI